MNRIVDGLCVSAEDGQFEVRDVADDSYSILTPSLGHPYCARAEDGFTVAKALNLWEQKFTDAPVLMYLRNNRTFALRVLRFTLDLTMKSVGVRSCTALEDPLFRDFICSPPNVDGSGPAIVIRPFNLDYFGKSQGRTRVPGLFPYDLSFLESHRYNGNGWTYPLVTPSTSEVIPHGFDHPMIVNSTERNDQLAQLPFSFEQGGDGDRHVLHSEAEDGFELSKGQVFASSSAPVRWLAFTLKDEGAGNRLGERFSGMEMASFYETLVPGRIVQEGETYYFETKVSINPILPRLWTFIPRPSVKNT